MNCRFHIFNGAAGTASKARTVLSLLVLTALIITLISALALNAAAETVGFSDGSTVTDMPNGGVPGDNSDNPGVITDPAGSGTSSMLSSATASGTNTPGTATDTASAMDEGGSIVGIIIAIVVVIAVIIIVIALIPKKK